MARTTVGQLHTAITADAAQYISEFKRAQSATKNATSAISSSLASLGVGLSVAGVIAFGKSVLDLGGQITDLTMQSGMSAQGFQAIAVTAMESGLAFEQTAKGAENMRSKIQDAASGNVAAAATFKALNLDAVGLKALAPEQQWYEIARAVANATDKQAAMNAVSDIFGAKIGPKIRDTLAAISSGGFDALSKSTKDLRMSDEQLATLDRAGDAMARIWHMAKMAAAIPIVAMVGKKEDVVDVSSPNAQIAILQKRIAAYDARGRGDSPNAMAYKDTLAVLQAKQRATEALAAASATAAAKQGELNATEMAAAIARGDAAAVQKAEAKIIEEDVKKYLKVINQQIAAEHMVGEKRREANAILDDQVAGFIAALDPLSAYKKELIAIDDAFRDGRLTGDQAAASIARINTEIKDLQGTLIDKELNKFFGDLDERSQEAGPQIDRALHQFFDDLDAQSKGARKVTEGFTKDMHMMWGQVADDASAAMADILMNGTNAFEELGRVIVRTMLTAMIKAQLIMPIMNYIGGAAGLIPGLFGIPAAAGGYRDGSQPYLVGEHGPEVFNPGTGGTVIPNNRVASIGGGSGDVATYYIDATGADAAKLSQLESTIRSINGSIEHRAIGAVIAAKRRGGGTAAALS